MKGKKGLAERIVLRCYSFFTVYSYNEYWENHSGHDAAV